jgi:hypothetical protein
VLWVRIEADARTTRDTGPQTATQAGVIGEDATGNRLEPITTLAGNSRVGNFTRIFPKGSAGHALGPVWEHRER